MAAMVALIFKELRLDGWQKCFTINLIALAVAAFYLIVYHILIVHGIYHVTDALDV